MKTKHIGFVGLGLMGTGMVKNLLSGGYSVIGYDNEQSKIDKCIEMGGAGIKAAQEIFLAD